MGRIDGVRKYLDEALESYELAATPAPAYFEPHEQSRETQLRIGIDIKYILKRYLAELPLRRAAILTQWLKDGSNYAEYALSWIQRRQLRQDRRNLKKTLIKRGYNPKPRHNG